MSALEDARDRLLALQERFAASRAGEPAWLARLREGARESFREQGLPSTKLEGWRYTNLSPLAKTALALPATGDAGIARPDLEAVAAPVFACSLHVFVDGRYDPKLSALGRRSDVHVESLADLLDREPERLEPHLGRLVDPKRQPLAALATAFLADGAVLRAPRGARVEEPLHVVFVSTGGPAVRSPRVLVVAEEGSRVQLIEDHVSLAADPGFSNAVTEVFVGPRARVDLVLLERPDDEALLASHVAARVERDGHFTSHALTFGGRLVRNDLTLELAGEGGTGDLFGLFVGSGERVVDNHTLVDHAVPHGTSRELYKGILGGRSRGVFRGRVSVRPDAQQTAAEQSNPNLLLSDGAEVDTRPQLEIHADDVRCSHGSAIGRIDEDALFYLRSRGIQEEDARRLLVRGFAAEILATLPVEALREGLEEPLGRALAAASGAEETG